MTGQLIIDGVNIFTEYGICIVDGGYNGLVQYPSLKTPYFNDWPDEDGIEVDLSNPKLDIKKFTIQLGGIYEFGVRGLIDFLSDNAYHEFTFTEIGIMRKLRLNLESARSGLIDYKLFSLDFTDDFPLYNYTYEDPIPIDTFCGRVVEIDGVPLTNYGISVTLGSHNEIVKTATIKQNLLVNNAIINGAIYDPENVVFSHKDVSIKCYIKADINTFWRNYNALLHNLVQPGERTFWYDVRSEEFPCYYKSSNITNFIVINGEIFCTFDIVLVFTSFRLGGVDYLLASEDYELFVLEEDSETFIDMQYGNK
jgi:hypothetical protein